MKNKKISIIVILGLLTLAGQFYVVQSTSSTAQDRALAFIEDVLPIDSSKWNIELKVDSNATDTREHLDINNISASENDRVLIYFLGSMVGTADSIEVIFIIRDSTFLQGVMNIDNSPTYRQTYRQFMTSISDDNVTNFLAKYQSWSGLDSTKMIEMLSNLNITENKSISSNNILMTVQHPSDDKTELSWTFLNGSDSREFRISFQKDFPVSFYDERQISSINTPSPTPTPTIPEFSWMVILPFLLSMLSIAVILRHRKTISQNKPNV